MNSQKIKINKKSTFNWRLALLVVPLIPIITTQLSCKKLVEVPPPVASITEDFVYTTDATAIAVTTDLFTRMNVYPFQGGGGNIGLFAGLAADEYRLNGSITAASYLGYYKNALSPNPPAIAGIEHWSILYNFIFRCNAAIEGLTNSHSLTSVIKSQLLGEAKFMRSYIYFYLINMFGDVPLALVTDPAINSQLARSSKQSVYDQIINDLKSAQDLLSDNFLDPTLLSSTNERVRPTKWAASALLARVYLYVGDWANAETQSSLVINNSSLFSLKDSLNDVFLKNSREAIWQIQPVGTSYNTNEARTLIIPSGGPGSGTAYPVQLSTQLLNSFEIGDKRGKAGYWINSVTVGTTSYYFPFKYKVYLPNGNINNTNGTTYYTEYFMVLRLAEQYLIRAEARAQLGKTSEAQADLNTIRNRAGLPNYSAATPLLDAILHERQVELFSEWGHRWFDLKRTGKVDAVMTAVTPIKSGGTNTWKSYQQLYPLPLTDLQRDPNLLQNPGY